MLFTEPNFFVFFAAVFGVYWLLRHHTARKAWLLAASYAFYAAWDWRFLGLILVSTAIDYAAGLMLRRPSAPGGRRLWLILSLVANLGILGFFKYFNFFVDSTQGLMSLLGLEVSARTLSIVLPVGISFFTFQSMSYTLDVYRRVLEPVTNAVDFALYVAFFPQLVAGPIVRARDFLPQLSIPRRFSDIRFKAPLVLFLVGFFKKACLADNIGMFIDPVFESPGNYDSASIWIASFFYSVQIYCDFSGYTDMAIAVARLLGYELCPNFSFPYLARNIQEFWRRWHMSLSSWLRDYLYISLGGNRGTAARRSANLMITMLLGGLWHGASWNFVVWGGLHGAALLAHRIFQDRISGHRAPAPGWSIPATFVWVSFCWLVFRAQGPEDAWILVSGFISFQAEGSLSLPAWPLAWFVPMIAAHVLSSRRSLMERVEGVPDWLCAVGLGAAAAVILFFVPLHARPFIYFQF